MMNPSALAQSIFSASKSTVPSEEHFAAELPLEGGAERAAWSSE